MKNWRTTSYLAAFFFTLLYTIQGYARPDMSPLGPNIADKGSAFYHFSVNRFDSADGKRHYKVWTAVPDKPAPAAGFPVLYMLDGNAVMDRLSDDLLKSLSQQNPPVLVVIGYQTDLPFDLNARSYDYTPPVKESTALHGRAGGGSPVFRHLLEATIAPQAEKGVHIDPRQRAIWGHSLGGIFVLDAYLSSPFFHRYYATSPSLNRDYVGMLSQLRATDNAGARNKPLYLLEGSGAPDSNRRAPGPDILTKVRSTVASLREEGLPAAYRLYPGLSHGQMFDAGFQQALQDIAARPPATVR